MRGIRIESNQSITGRNARTDDDSYYFVFSWDGILLETKKPTWYPNTDLVLKGVNITADDIGSAASLFTLYKTTSPSTAVNIMDLSLEADDLISPNSTFYAISMYEGLYPVCTLSGGHDMVVMQLILSKPTATGSV